MNRELFDLRILVIKYDLEVKLSEINEDSVSILTPNERNILLDYNDADCKILNYVRDLLLDDTYKEDSVKLLHKICCQIEKQYPNDDKIIKQVLELANLFTLSIGTSMGNDICLFSPKSNNYEIKSVKNC